VLGGAVNGQRMYGNVSEPDARRSGRHRQRRTLGADDDSRAVRRDARKWFGASSSDLAQVFPNLKRFATADLGFMA